MWWTSNILMRVIGGSRAYGTHNETSDWDFRGVALPSVNFLIGFPPGEDSSFTKEVKNKFEDTVIHALSKYCRLALNGNPNILETLYCRDQEVLFMTQTGQELMDMRDLFLSKRCFSSLSGYALGQLKRMRVSNSNPKHGSNKKEIEKYGFDTKNAMHLIRLLIMGKELLQNGELKIYRDNDRDFLLDIRHGKYTPYQIEKMAEEMDAECGYMRDSSPLPNEPDRDKIETWLAGIQLRYLNWDMSIFDVIKGEK